MQWVAFSGVVSFFIFFFIFYFFFTARAGLLKRVFFCLLGFFFTQASFPAAEREERGAGDLRFVSATGFGPEERTG